MKKLLTHHRQSFPEVFSKVIFSILAEFLKLPVKECKQDSRPTTLTKLILHKRFLWDLYILKSHGWF